MEMTTALADEGAYARALAEFPPRPIRDDDANESAIALLRKLDALKNRTKERGDIAEMFVTLVEAYEERYAPKPATPREALV